jgi:hypothetical protein
MEIGLCNTAEIQNYWVSELYPSSGILNNKKTRFGNWICFRRQVTAERHILC